MRWSSRLCQRRAWAMLANPACRNAPVTRLRTAAKAAGWFPVRGRGLAARTNRTGVDSFLPIEYSSSDESFFP